MTHVDEAARRLSKSGSTLYAVLELKKGASPEDVKKAYSPLDPLKRGARSPDLTLTLIFSSSCKNPIFKNIDGIHPSEDDIFVLDGIIDPGHTGSPSYSSF
ncbi:hypothetical protein CB1_001264030 [Camelus ferus]|nr:hypothetical protein CB1_001264030 [Camelus ferus]